jgi:hypothetical protein
MLLGSSREVLMTGTGDRLQRAADDDGGDLVRSLALCACRAAGRARVRRRLERLVNEDVIGLAGAQKIYREAFGDHLVAVKVRQGLIGRIARRFG